MTSGNTNVTLDEQKTKHKLNNQRLIVFFICLMISAILWMMIRLSRDYTELERFSISYKGLQSDKILLPATDTVFYVNIQTNGYNILFDKLFPDKHQFEIDISQYVPKLVGNYFEINIETGTLHTALSYYFKANEKIISVLPVNLKIMLEKAYTKKVPVVLDAEISYAKQFNLNKKIYYEPDSIYITGNEQQLKSISSVTTEKKYLKDLSANTIVSLKLLNKFSNLNIRYSTDNVKLFIPVTQYTEEFFEIPVLIDSLKDDAKISVIPEKVRIYFYVNVPDFPNLKVDSFSTAISAFDILNSKNNLAKVYLKHAPYFVKVQRIEPEFVEFVKHK